MANKNENSFSFYRPFFRKKYFKVLSFLLSIFFFCFVSIIYFPFLHNLDDDINIWNVKTFIILEGEHHHDANPKSPGIEFHKIKLIDINDCLICQILNNVRFVLSYQHVSFFYSLNFLSINIQKVLYICRVSPYPIFEQP